MDCIENVRGLWWPLHSWHLFMPYFGVYSDFAARPGRPLYLKNANFIPVFYCLDHFIRGVMNGKMRSKHAEKLGNDVTNIKHRNVSIF